MKSKNIPADISAKSLKDAQTEIREIIDKFEEKGMKLEESIELYNRMTNLNFHIQELFKKKAKQIKQSTLKKYKKSGSKK